MEIVAQLTEDLPTLSLHLKVLVNPTGERSYSAACLETGQGVVEPTLEEAVRVITELVDSQLQHFKRGFPLQGLLHQLPPKFYDVFNEGIPYRYQRRLSSEVREIVGSIEYRISDEVLTLEKQSEWLSG